MLVRDQVQVLHAGQTLELSCEFYMEGFDLFDNPIIWKKVQRNEEKNINIMGNIQQPFVGTGRFTVIFVQSPPRYKLLLSISGRYRTEHISLMWLLVIIKIVVVVVVIIIIIIIITFIIIIININITITVNIISIVIIAVVVIVMVVVEN